MTLKEQVIESCNRNNGNSESVAEEFKRLSNVEYTKVLDYIKQLEQ